MREFFRGWRRKIGCLTLLIACAFAAGWVRSVSIVDAVILPVGNHTLMSVVSFDQSITLEIEVHENRRITWDFLDWESGPPKAPDPGFGTRWLWRWLGFGVADGVNFPDIPPSFCPATIWAIPYWSLTIPMTLISIWLLLKKPSKSNQKKILDPISDEVT